MSKNAARTQTPNAQQPAANTQEVKQTKKRVPKAYPLDAMLWVLSSLESLMQQNDNAEAKELLGRYRNDMKRRLKPYEVREIRYVSKEKP